MMSWTSQGAAWVSLAEHPCPHVPCGSASPSGGEGATVPPGWPGALCWWREGTDWIDWASWSTGSSVSRSKSSLECFICHGCSKAEFEGTAPRLSELSGCPGCAVLPWHPWLCPQPFPLGQVGFCTLGSNFVFRIFWAKWRKIRSLSLKRARISSLQCWKAGAGKAFHQPCFLPLGGTSSVPPSAPPGPWDTWQGPQSTLGAGSEQ